jgi:hypothetical protein
MDDGYKDPERSCRGGQVNGQRFEVGLVVFLYRHAAVRFSAESTE